MTAVTKGNTISDLEIENKEELKMKKDELVGLTLLSPREAEIFLLYTDRNNELDEMQEVAEKLGIEKPTAYQHWRNIKDKVRKARETVNLDEKLE